MNFVQNKEIEKSNRAAIEKIEWNKITNVRNLMKRMRKEKGRGIEIKLQEWEKLKIKLAKEILIK